MHWRGRCGSTAPPISTFACSPASRRLPPHRARAPRWSRPSRHWPPRPPTWCRRCSTSGPRPRRPGPCSARCSTSPSPTSCAGSSSTPPRPRRYRPNWNEDAASSVAHLRMAARPDQPNPALDALVAELSAASPEFRQLWAGHEVQLCTSGLKVLVHPDLGVFTTAFDSFRSSDGTATLVLLRPAGDDRSRTVFDMLTTVELEFAWAEPDSGLRLSRRDAIQSPRDGEGASPGVERLSCGHRPYAACTSGTARRARVRRSCRKSGFCSVPV